MMTKRGNKGFSEKQLSSFAETLEGLRVRTLREIQDRIADKRELDHNKNMGDAQDIASDETDREMSFLLTGRDRQKIMQIDSAMARIREGSYGICDECEEPIGVKRLQAMPFTRYCVSCQQEIEEINKLAQQRELEEEEKAYIEFAMTEPDPVDD